MTGAHQRVCRFGPLCVWCRCTERADRSLTIEQSKATLQCNPESSRKLPLLRLGSGFFEPQHEMIRLRRHSVHAAVRFTVPSDAESSAEKSWWPDMPLEERRTSRHAGPAAFQQGSCRGEPRPLRLCGHPWLPFDSRLAQPDTRAPSGNDLMGVNESWRGSRRERLGANAVRGRGTHPARVTRDATRLDRLRRSSKLGAP